MASGSGINARNVEQRNIAVITGLLVTSQKLNRLALWVTGSRLSNGLIMQSSMNRLRIYKWKI